MRALRRDVHIDASYNLTGLADESNAATIRNTGSGGCTMEVSVPLGTGSQLELHIDHKSLKNLSAVKATVRHARKLANKYYIGVSFEGLSDSTRASIIDWVHQVETEIYQAEAL